MQQTLPALGTDAPLRARKSRRSSSCVTSSRPMPPEAPWMTATCSLPAAAALGAKNDDAWPPLLAALARDAPPAGWPGPSLPTLLACPFGASSAASSSTGSGAWAEGFSALDWRSLRRCSSKPPPDHRGSSCASWASYSASSASKLAPPLPGAPVVSKGPPFGAFGRTPQHPRVGRNGFMAALWGSRHNGGVATWRRQLQRVTSAASPGLGTRQLVLDSPFFSASVGSPECQDANDVAAAVRASPFHLNP